MFGRPRAGCMEVVALLPFDSSCYASGSGLVQTSNATVETFKRKRSEAQIRIKWLLNGQRPPKTVNVNRKTIYFVRHGQTDFNKLFIVQGSGVDSDLNEKGRAQAASFFKAYREVNFDVVITSKLVRTHQTMEHFIEMGLPWEQFEEINEMSWGIHEGKKGSPEMKADYKNMIEQWNKGNYDIGIPGGETAAQLGQRINRFIDHLQERREETILVCSHGRAMRCLMSQLKREPLYTMEQYQHSNTGLYKIAYNKPQFIFELENDTQHLSHMEHLYHEEKKEN